MTNYIVVLRSKSSKIEQAQPKMLSMNVTSSETFITYHNQVTTTVTGCVPIDNASSVQIYKNATSQ